MAAMSLMLFLSVAFSQKTVHPGYYINLQGDTIKGIFRDYRQWNYNPDKVGFVPLAQENLLRLEPSNCKECHVSNFDTYISYTGKRLTNPIDFPSASSSDNADTYDTVTVFLRQTASTDPYRFYVYKDKLRINIGKALTNHHSILPRRDSAWGAQAD